MEPLNKLQNLIFQVGGILLLIGVVMPLYAEFTVYAPYVYTIGAVMFATMQMMNRYKGTNIIIKRLRRQQLLGAFLLLVTGVMMFMSLYQVGPFLNDEWKVALAIGTVFEVYTSFRLPALLEKEQNEQ